MTRAEFHFICSRLFNAKNLIDSARLLALAVGFLAGLLAAAPSWAGFFEVGLSGSYRRSNIDRNAYDEFRSLTASLSYYLDESSALELSYTDGRNLRVTGEGLPIGNITDLTYKMIGLDLVLTMGDRQSAVRPYVKIGGVYIAEKQIVQVVRDQSGVYPPQAPIRDEPALVPSAGAGFRLALSQTMSLKIGAEAWASRPLNVEPVTIDYAGRAGLSWMF